MAEMFKSKLFRAGIWILLIFLIILVGTQISFVFTPFVVIIKTLFFPFLIAGFLYFLIHPFVGWLQGKKIPKSIAILLIYLVFFGIIGLLAALIGPVLQREVTRLIVEAPEIINVLRDKLMSLQQNPVIARLVEEEPQFLEETANWLTNLLNNLFTIVLQNVASFFDFAADLFVVIVTVPFILYYTLKDGHRWPEILYRYLPEKYAGDIQYTLRKMNKTISSYIQGIFVVCICVGVLVYIGYLIIGLDYPLLLATFAMFTNVIPFLGPVIGIIPGIIVAALHSPLMVLKVIAIVVVVQQMESLLISPQVMGKKLAIGPLAVILVVLVSGRMAGLLGMILALPSFMVLKIITNHIYNFVQSSKQESLR